MARATDPICGMSVDTAKPAAKGTYDGTTVYFCSAACQTAYEARRKRP